MSFEDKIREKIKKSQVGSCERDLLKLVLGECQQEMGTLTEERANNIVKKILKSNEECLEHLTPEDARHARLLSENQILADLLPKYLTEEQVQALLVDVDVKSANNDGQAMGAAMKHLKELGVAVEGSVVKAVVAQLRAS